MLEFTHSLTPVLPALLSRVRALFDLDARPDLIAQHLARDTRLPPRSGRIPACACRAASTDSSSACARSSASR